MHSTRSSLNSPDSWGNHNLKESFIVTFYLIRSPNLINKGRFPMIVITVARKWENTDPYDTGGQALGSRDLL
jgi:hypothetical protein